MTSDDLKRRVKAWAKQLGYKEAMKRLVNADISVAVAQKLLNGTYVSALKLETAQAISKELDKDSGVAAS